jgi:nucleoside-diphosphate-sugar epimerase
MTVQENAGIYAANIDLLAFAQARLRPNMSRVFITGSSTGLGLMAGRVLAEQGHQVVVHARDERRASGARAALPAAADIVIGDASRLNDLNRMADQLNRLGRFDAVIHNVGIGYREPRRILTGDGLPHVLAINVIAPYVLTALMERPSRLVYLSWYAPYGSSEPLGHNLGEADLGLAAPLMRRASSTTFFWHSRFHGVGAMSSQSA